MWMPKKKSLLASLRAVDGQEDRLPPNPPKIASGCYLLLSTPSSTTIQIAVKSGRVLGFACAYGHSAATRGQCPVPGWPGTLQVGAVFALRRQSQKLPEPRAAPPWGWKPRSVVARCPQPGGPPLWGGCRAWGGGPGKDATMGYSTKVPIFSPTEPPAAAMDEWDLPQWKKEVESLKYQLAYKREMSSKTIPE